MPNTPTTPSISRVTVNQALITNGPDGNPSTTFYAYQFTYVINLSTIVMYLNSSGTFSSIPVYMNVSSQLANALVPNVFFTVTLSAATDAFGSNATVFGPPATFTTLAAQPLAEAYSGVYSTQATANWQANFNNDQTQYQVQYSTDPSFIQNVITSPWITDTSFLMNNLLPNTVYFTRVQARNSVLTVTPFTSLGPVTTTNGPAVVQGISSTNLLANRGFLIRWAANTEPDIAWYRVYRSSSPTDNSSFYVIGTTPPNVTSFVDNVPFTFGITWYYKVTAIDTGNNESSLDLTNPVQDMTFSQFVEQPFPTQVEVGDLVNGEIPVGVINGASTTITTVTDATHLVVSSTTGFVAGAALDVTAAVSFNITTVVDATHLVVSSTAGMSANDVINQGNTVFATVNPFKTSTLSVFLNGVKLMNGVDYNVNIPQQFTLVSAPLVGDSIRVDYLKY